MFGLPFLKAPAATLMPEAPQTPQTPPAPDAPQPAPGSAAPRPAVAVAAQGLDRAATGQPCRVLAVASPDGLPDWGRWLAEIGFLPGEAVQVMSRSVWGGDPMVVRVGHSTFALRRAEAACVRVEPW